MTPSRHLSPETLLALAQGTLADDQLSVCAGHVAQCTHCADLLVEIMEDHLHQAPAGFADSVYYRLQLQAEEKSREFRSYCIRVTASVAVVVLCALSTLLLPARSIRLPEQPPQKEYHSLYEESETKESLLAPLYNLFEKHN